MKTTFEACAASHPDGRGSTSLSRIVVWVGAVLREAREATVLLELIADSRIATPGTVRRRLSTLDSLA